jgi:hippurate hydrolase
MSLYAIPPRRLRALPILLSILVGNSVFAADPASVTTKELSSLVALYKDLHAHPELSLHEEQTAARLARELRDAGLEVTEKVGLHGIVGVLKNGDGPVILVRTELDALPVKEKTGLPYASTIVTKDDVGGDVPVMHACGHDVHMACFIGTARVMALLRDQWRGTLVMIGQPAEERVMGARLMLRAGLFSKFPTPDKALALHCSAEMAHGTIGITEGFALANVDSMDIVVRGVGGHGSMPHLAKDPVVLASEIVLALQTIVSREIRQWSLLAASTVARSTTSSRMKCVSRSPCAVTSPRRGKSSSRASGALRSAWPKPRVCPRTRCRWSPFRRRVRMRSTISPHSPGKCAKTSRVFLAPITC